MSGRNPHLLIRVGVIVVAIHSISAHVLSISFGVLTALSVLIGLLPLGLALLVGGLCFIAMLPKAPRLVATYPAAVACTATAWTLAVFLSWSAL